MQMTHAALVCLGGDVDATLAMSEENALAYLRQRAERNDWNGSNSEGFTVEYATATLEELNRCYDDNTEEDTWVKIATLTAPIEVTKAFLY